MNIELTAHTTKLLHLSVMDLCSMWCHQLCPRNPGLVFGFATDLLCEFGLITLSCCASLVSLPCCCPSLATYVQWGCLRTGIGFCCAQRMLFSILTFAKATSQLNNNNMPIHISVCVSPFNPSWHTVHFGTHLLIGTAHWHWPVFMSWLRKSKLSLPWLPICLQHHSKVLLLILTSIIEIVTIMAHLAVIFMRILSC